MITKEDLAQAILNLGDELRASQEKTSREVDKLSQYVGNIGKNQGSVAEEFFINSISPTLKLGNIQYDELYKNLYKKTKKAEGEFDIVLVNGTELALIETKYKAHENDVDDLINKKYNNFKKLYPEYKDYNHHLGLASFFISDQTKERALNNNVMILQRKGEILETILPSN
jgi:Holliday junction resolvase-like predicted endonuclease